MMGRYRERPLTSGGGGCKEKKKGKKWALGINFK